MASRAITAQSDCRMTVLTQVRSIQWKMSSTLNARSMHSEDSDQASGDDGRRPEKYRDGSEHSGPDRGKPLIPHIDRPIGRPMKQQRVAPRKPQQYEFQAKSRVGIESQRLGRKQRQARDEHQAESIPG